MGILDPIFSRVTGADPRDAGVAASEPRNAAIHVASLTLIKVADGLVQPKLVLAWLLGSLGAPAAVIGALVPIREAGSMLPQLALAGVVAAAPRRKRIWALGAVFQGLGALGIAASALLLDGVLAWAGVLSCLAVLAVARSLCSLAHKDALARTIGKTRRGAVSGAAGSLGSIGVLGFGVALTVGLVPLTPLSISLAIAVAGGLWLLAAVLFQGLDERASDERAGDTGGEERERGPAALLRPLWRDPQLQRFIVSRGLLTSTALAPPFVVMLSATASERGLAHLGPLVLSASAASIVSSYVWGRLTDRSSRLTMMVAGALATLALGGIALVGAWTGGLGGAAGAVVAVFVVQIAYEGARAGRKLHLTDMAGDDQRARYTALSNTIIAIILLATSGIGAVAQSAGVPAVLGLLAVASGVSVVVTAGLEDVQRADRSPLVP